MKVTKDSGFQPITIVLETEEEATYMWACLNVSGNVVQDQNRRLTLADRVGLKLWQTYKDVYII